tara:strand:- start:463 stop:1287 length:825 start_codon:yes stop_codon:yes gene_type:complete
MDSTNPAFHQANEALKNEDAEKLEQLFDTSKAVEDYVDGNISVKEGVVRYKTEEVHGHVVGRILDFMRQGLPYKPLVKFLDKLMSNPSRRATQELYAFLEHKSMPLTPDGNFLAYKSVREDYTDWHSGKFDNNVGNTLEMTRNSVCDDANIGCSDGFHAGSLEYARTFGHSGNLMIVEIDPSDVVSVPTDCNCQKLRTCKYKVVSLFERKLEEPLCDDYGDYDDDYDEEVDEPCNAYDDAYNAGYNAAKADLGMSVPKTAKRLLKRDKLGRFSK